MKMKMRMKTVSYTHLDVYKRQEQETVRKTEYSGSNGGYKGVTSEKTVATVTAERCV